MIGKLKKGASFGGCVRYVTGKDEAKILASDGVLLGTNAEIVQSFELQRQLNPRIKNRQAETFEVIEAFRVGSQLFATHLLDVENKNRKAAAPGDLGDLLAQ